MAPINPRSALKRTTVSFPSPSTTFTTTKKDKRIMKHSLIVSKSQSSSDRSRGVKKRRRPTRKLVADIQSLAEALPEELDEALPSQSSKNKTKDAHMRSIGSKRGAKKQIQKVVEEEQNRFGKNLAILSQAAPAPAATTNTGGASKKDARWAALRTHLQGTIANG